MEIDFSQVSELLGGMSDEELRNLQDAAQSLFASYGGPEPEPEPEPARQQGFGQDGGMGAMFTPEMLAKLSRMMRGMNRSDPRTDLILALRPHLSRPRQRRAEQAVQMMKMLELLPTLQEAMR